MRNKIIESLMERDIQLLSMIKNNRKLLPYELDEVKIGTDYGLGGIWGEINV